MARWRPFQALDERLRRWVLRRVPRTPGTVTVRGSKVYILPTRFGLGFAVLTLVILLGAMNYSNSMGFALSFLLAGLGLVSMHHTHAQLAGLAILAGPVEPGFAGTERPFGYRLQAQSRRPRRGLVARWAYPDRLATEDLANTAVPAADETRLEVPLLAERRGWLEAPILELSSTYPLGLFRAWTFVWPESRALIYPKPAPEGLPLPRSVSADPGETERGAPGRERFQTLRGYQRGDPLNALHWKSLPKLGVPLVKQFEDPQAPETWLRLAETPGAGLEARLSQLCRWVLELDAAGLSYGLDLGDPVVPVGSGPGHRRRCLEALALYGRAP